MIERREKGQEEEEEEEVEVEVGENAEEKITLEPHGILVLLRHGQSMWNRSPKDPDGLWRYAGSCDIALSPVGVIEAMEAGERIHDIPFDTVFSSCLSRATMTALLALNAHSSGKTPICACSTGKYTDALESLKSLPEGTAIPVVCSEKLNERNFGDLEAVPSTEHFKRFNNEELRHIRNDFFTPFPGEKGESSFDVYNRAIPYFEEEILPLLRKGQNVLLVSHGFVMRTLIKYLDDMSDEEWNYQMSIEKTKPEECLLLAATGVPLLYQFPRYGEEGNIRDDEAESEGLISKSSSANSLSTAATSITDRSIPAPRQLSTDSTVSPISASAPSTQKREQHERRRIRVRPRKIGTDRSYELAQTCAAY